MRRRKNASHIVAKQPEKNTTASVDVGDAKKEYFRIESYLTKLRNGLLGTFSANGKYKISDEKILQELLVLPKKFGEKEDNIVYASSILGSHVLNFKIELNLDPSYCSATLFLIEIEHKFDEDIKHITELGNTVEPYSPLFKENVYKLWKVYIDQEEYEKNDFLHTYLSLQQHDYDFSKELIEILSQLYLVRMLKLLDSMGELGEKIKLDYKMLVEKMLQNDPSITQDNTRFKAILDSVILKNKAFDKILETKDGATILNGYSTPIKNVLEKSAPVKNVEVETGEKKPEEKKKEPAKPAAKKKGKSKGGDSVKPWIFDISKVPKNDYKVPEPIIPPKPQEKPATKTEEKPAEERNETIVSIEKPESSNSQTSLSDEELVKSFLSQQTLITESLGEESKTGESSSLQTNENIAEVRNVIQGRDKKDELNVGETRTFYKSKTSELAK